MLIPVPLTRQKWMNIKIRALEQKWFDDYGQFYTYVLKNAVIDEIVDEEELIWQIVKTIVDEGLNFDEKLRERIMLCYGIAEEYVDIIYERVRNKVKAIEAEFCRRKSREVDRRIDEKTYRESLAEIQKMFLEENLDRATIIKIIALEHGLDEHDARDIVSVAESLLFA